MRACPSVCASDARVEKKYNPDEKKKNIYQPLLKV